MWSGFPRRLYASAQDRANAYDLGAKAAHMVGHLPVLMGWFVCVSEMSWPPPVPQENHAEATLDHKLSRGATPPPLKEATTPSAKKHPMKKVAPVQEKETTEQAPVNQ